jgi:hypothetical protein
LAGGFERCEGGEGGDVSSESEDVSTDAVEVPDFSPVEEWGGFAGISNCDFSIDDGCEEALRGGRWTRYAGWNFNGRCWFNGNKFHCQVWRYGTPLEVISADTLKDLMHAVSDVYGYE